MVEQGTHKPLVVGSNPSLATISKPSPPLGLARGLCNTPTGEATVQYDLDHPVDRTHSDSRKWGYFDPDVLPLWIADMDFPSPEPVLRALHKRVEHGIFGYASPPLDLYEAIQARLEALYDWHVETRDLVLLPGVVTGFNLACHAIGQRGDGVLIQPPVYYPFLYAPVHADRKRQDAQVQLVGERYQIDFDEFEQAITERTRLFILCNPHNPVGRVYEGDELAQLAEICLHHNIVVCSDEIHCDLVYQGHRHIPIASLAPEIGQQTITLMAPSKTFNIAGLGCSFAVISNPEIREQFRAARSGLVSNVNLVGRTAALAAYRSGQEWLDQVLLYLEDNRHFLVQYVSENMPGVRVIVPEGTYLVWLDCREAGIPREPGQFFHQEARVALNQGHTFGPGGEGFVRLNFACPRATLHEALERMHTALERLT